MKPKYRFLISAIDALGHINCTLGFGEILAEAGHEVTFVQRIHHKKLADKRGFNFIPFDESIFENIKPGPFVDWVANNLEKFRGDALERYKGWTDEDKEIFASIAGDYEIVNQALEKVLDEHKDSFDAFIGDFVTQYPALFRSPIPYIPLLSISPVCLYPQGPPQFSGYPEKVDREKAEEFEQTYESACSKFIEKLYAWWTSHEVPLLSIKNFFIDNPKYFGFYHYPEGLDYKECGPKEPADKWFRIDASIRKPDEESEFVIPESIASLPGKLIYFSLGSLGSADVELMRQIISLLSKLPHRFIVSKGPKGDEIDLPPNMWGQNYVNQIAIIKVVDMVITHGGNNTFLETIYSGKPLIVIPYFFDQFDNAQRVVDCGIGRRLDTWNLDEKIVSNAIEETLNDQEMTRKIKEIALSMRSTKSREKAVEMIENLISDLKNNNLITH
ncbi:NDP-glycosyltransferase YjiC-like [Panonychus citri]|uniref:NDP-glycosyltransferase YjiC-like n=1 Tax=Panonychus citri TaxID=50023 RepID=UPI002307116C|nr:NDP-glycosyltransferase YjiC-like [Panonychus citri]